MITRELIEKWKGYTSHGEDVILAAEAEFYAARCAYSDALDAGYAALDALVPRQERITGWTRWASREAVALHQTLIEEGGIGRAMPLPVGLSRRGPAEYFPVARWNKQARRFRAAARRILRAIKANSGA